MGKCISKPKQEQNKDKVVVVPVFKKHKASGCTMTHLVVDDSEYNREIIRKYLQRVGVKCDEAQNGKIAVDMVTNDKTKYDMVWMDVKMPIMDGIDATKEMRLNGFHGPVVGITGAIEPNAKIKYAEAELSMILDKPILKEVLYATIKELCPLYEDF